MSDQEPTSTALMPSSPNLFGVDAIQATRQAWALASVLKDVIARAGLVVGIQGREYVRVEGWTMLGSSVGVFPIVVWTRRMESLEGVGAGWEACVEARTKAGEVLGRAEAQCCRDERSWSTRDDYALRAMAQTRATSRAMRGPLGFIVALAGYQTIAAEEMPQEG